VERIVLFHHAQGLRRDVLDWADALREAGHEVDTPDLFEGVTFEQLEDGIAHRDELGIPTLIGRAAEFLEGLPDELAYAGFSMGASSAHYFAVTRPGARAALLMHGTAPPATLGERGWPSEVPAQLHCAAEDPYVDTARIEAAEQAVREAEAPLEVFTYPLRGHLFADPDGPDYDRDSAQLMLERELALLGRL
jgi:dienelactone hydrolase